VKLIPFTAALALVGIFSVSAQAQSLNFDFSYQANNYGGEGQATGIVTGEIIGLENNATSVPSDVIITSAPAALDLSTPFDFGTGGNQGTPGLTVNNDVISSSGNLFIYDVDGISFGLDDTTDLLENNNGTENYPEAFNDGGLAAVTFTLEAAPEPSPLMLMLIGGGFFGLWRMWRRRTPCVLGDRPSARR
jgi:hypothetical protein